MKSHSWSPNNVAIIETDFIPQLIFRYFPKIQGPNGTTKAKMAREELLWNIS
jgi:hypothetical protein